MTDLGWSLVDVVSRLLEPDEREAVRGDLAEAGESSWHALFEVLGLIVRRQATLWRSWRPWLTFVVTMLTIPTWSSRGPWIPNWALSWPAWYLVATGRRRGSEAGER